MIMEALHVQKNIALHSSNTVLLSRQYDGDI